MGRRAPATRAAMAAALAAVVATGGLGLGYARADPHVTTPDRGPVAAAPPARPAPGDGPARPEPRSNGVPDMGAASERGAPGRVQAAAPRPPEATPGRAVPPAGSRPTGPPGPPPVVTGTPCTAVARACVALLARQAWLLDAGRVVRGPVPIQHGDLRDPTPRGTFGVQWKAEQYTSREHLTQMPYSVFFADGGIAFHEGAQDNPSAGCVKLGHEDAKAFFYFLQVGDEVQIH
jgi:lipoprotein-anchoring transpeptidase ErfK/SrfK